jgi:cytochrome c
MHKAIFPAALLAVALASLESVGAATPAPEGETLFRQRCSMCHSVVPSQPKTLGPVLSGVVGRKAASTAFNYSPALKASGLTWSKPNLDRFLTSPMRMVPGTRMVITVPDAAQRAALIGYLEMKK